MRDYQKSKVYKWENKHIPEGQFVPFENIKSIVEYVWNEAGLKYPPLIVKLSKNCCNVRGKGSRQKLQFPEAGETTKTILHEIAHAMTDNIHNDSNRHGPIFVGVYMQLVDKYMKIPGGLGYLWFSATKENVKYEMFAKPTINNLE